MERKYHYISALAPGFRRPDDNEEYRTLDEEERNVEVCRDQANAVSSVVADQKPYGDDFELWHAPVLDIDVPAQLIPSSTAGHGHLYIDVAMPWPMYEKLLRVLAECGVIEQGYADVSIMRGATYVRTPENRKPVDDEAF